MCRCHFHTCYACVRMKGGPFSTNCISFPVTVFIDIVQTIKVIMLYKLVPVVLQKTVTFYQFTSSESPHFNKHIPKNF